MRLIGQFLLFAENVPVRDTPFACCVCGTVHPDQSERYRDHVCRTCERRATCSHGRVVHGSDVSLSGGLAAHDTSGADVCDQVTADHRVWIDGAEHRTDEARFGGTVVVRAH